MRYLFLGWVYALVAACVFSLLASLLICAGIDPEARSVADAAAPLLGIWVGASLASRASSWETGVGVGLLYVSLWVGFWAYVMGRYNPLAWFEEGLPHLTVTHLAWWGAAILAGALGGAMRRLSLPLFLVLVILACAGMGALMFRAAQRMDFAKHAAEEPIPGYTMERQDLEADGTTVYTLTFDFQKQSLFRIGVYDCDSDDAHPGDDANTSFLGQSLETLVDKLDYRAEAVHHQLLAVINGGFFGESGFSVAHHEEPLVQDGRALYHVDLLRPKEQGWFFAVNASTRLPAGQPRFSMLPEIPWDKLGNYQTVLGGVRPLRVNGRSVSLKPGAGNTGLRCSRTSIGWSADGNKFYILVVHDPDGELASQVQRKMHRSQTGGWDVSEVQHFWEQKQVPFALLCDGGESTQLAFRRADDTCHDLMSGYQYSFTVGYLFQRPLLITLPILPPSEAHRGVLNYLYVEGPARTHP